MEKDASIETRLHFLKRHLDEVEANLTANRLFNETLLNTVQLVQRTVDHYHIVNLTSMVEETISPETIKHLKEQYSKLHEAGVKGIMKSIHLLESRNYSKYFNITEINVVIKELYEIHAILELLSEKKFLEDSLHDVLRRFDSILSLELTRNNTLNDIDLQRVSERTQRIITSSPVKTVATASADAMSAAPADADLAASSGKMFDVPAYTFSTASTDKISAHGVDAFSAAFSDKMSDVSADTVSTAPIDATSAANAYAVSTASADAVSAALAEAADDVLE